MELLPLLLLSAMWISPIESAVRVSAKFYPHWVLRYYKAVMYCGVAPADDLKANITFHHWSEKSRKWSVLDCRIEQKTASCEKVIAEHAIRQGLDCECVNGTDSADNSTKWYIFSVENSGISDKDKWCCEALGVKSGITTFTFFDNPIIKARYTHDKDNNNTLQVICDIQGLPYFYSMSKFTHVWKGHTIREIPGVFLNSSSYNTNDQPGQKGQPFLPLYSYELTIQPYSYKDSGTYLCIMSYTLKEGGRKEVAAETLVDFVKPFVLESSTANDTVKVMIQHSLNITKTVYSYDNITSFSWTNPRDGMRRARDITTVDVELNIHDVHVKDRGHAVSLQIEEVGSQDRGLYTFTACNQHECGTFNTQLVVRGVIIKMYYTINYAKNTISVICQAEGSHTEYNYNGFTQLWKGQVVRQMQGTLNATQGYVLTIPSYSFRDTGTYLCAVTSTVEGDDSVTQTANTTVIINTHPGAADLSLANESVQVNLGDNLTISKTVFSEVSIISNTWTIPRDNNTIKHIGRVTASKVELVIYDTRVMDKGYIIWLPIGLIEEEDVGLYTVRVCNLYGCASFFTEVVSDETTPAAQTINPVIIGSVIGGIVMMIICFIVYVYRRRKSSYLVDEVNSSPKHSQDQSVGLAESDKGDKTVPSIHDVLEEIKSLGVTSPTKYNRTLLSVKDTVVEETSSDMREIDISENIKE